MPIIDLNKVVNVWMAHVKHLNFHERMELQRMILASFEVDYNDLRNKK